MLQHLSTSLIFIGCVYGALDSAFGKDKKDLTPVEENFDIILRAVGTPDCLRTCIDPFLATLDNVWKMDNVVPHSEIVCSKYTEARSCLKKKSLCDTQKMFETASSGMYHLCEKQMVLFEKMKDCLEGKVGAVMQECDSKCHNRANVTAFAQNPAVQLAANLGGNVFIVSDHIGGLCKSLSCALPCVTKGLNAVCPLSGWLMLDAMLQPFEAVAHLLENMSPGLRDIIHNKVDKSCRFAINKVHLLKLRKGQFEEFSKL